MWWIVLSCIFILWYVWSSSISTEYILGVSGPQWADSAPSVLWSVISGHSTGCCHHCECDPPDSPAQPSPAQPRPVVMIQFKCKLSVDLCPAIRWGPHLATPHSEENKADTMILYYYITGKDIERWFEGFLLTKPNQVLRTSIPITVENLGQSLSTSG